MKITNTNLSPAWLMLPALATISLLIFILPFLAGQKQPAVVHSVKQNMIFFQETVDKFISIHHRAPLNIQELHADAKKNNYNKTFFNPISKHSGDMNHLQIITQYNKRQLTELGPEFKSVSFAGKVGFFTDGLKYVIYGHEYAGKLIQEKETLYQIGNF
jgi:hypothetical protein